MRIRGYKSMDGLAKPERSEGFGADRVLGFEGAPTDGGDEKKCHGGRFFDASHREQSELGEICTLGVIRAVRPRIFKRDGRRNAAELQRNVVVCAASQTPSAA